MVRVGASAWRRHGARRRTAFSAEAFFSMDPFSFRSPEPSRGSSAQSVQTWLTAYTNDHLRRILREADHRVKQAGASFRIAYLPTVWRYRRGRGDDGNFAHRDLVLGWMREDGFEVVDFGDVVGKHHTPLALFGLGGHYNSQGYRRLAELLATHWKGRRLTHGPWSTCSRGQRKRSGRAYGALSGADRLECRVA